MKSKKPATTTSRAAAVKPGRADIRREEPRRAAPRATGRTAERGNQPRTHKAGKK